MRAANGTGANRATGKRIREAVAALGAEEARRLEELISQAEADLDEAFELLMGAKPHGGDLHDGLTGAYYTATEGLDRFHRAVLAGADMAEGGAA
jgi:hypothetical protein